MKAPKSLLERYRRRHKKKEPERMRFGKRYEAERQFGHCDDPLRIEDDLRVTIGEDDRTIR